MLYVGYDTEFAADETTAKEMLASLVEAYPGWRWFVVIKGGIIHIKNLNFSDQWGMALKYSDLKDDASQRKRSALRAAGEFLERACRIRGAKTDEPIKQVEGIADKYLAGAKLREALNV